MTLYLGPTQTGSTTGLYNVPAGKRLVIDYANSAPTATAYFGPNIELAPEPSQFAGLGLGLLGLGGLAFKARRRA